MSKHYPSIAFTDEVQAIQHRYGSDMFYGRKRRAGQEAPGTDPLTDNERDFLAARDGFYLATVSATGWPYVQYRGGPAGFVRVVDEHTIGWADFQGNLQYISTGNVTGDDRVAIIALDYPQRARLKIFGHARIVTVDEDPDLVTGLADVSYDAVLERAVLVDVVAFDWNCQQHIVPRYTDADLAPALQDLRDQIEALRTENAELRRQLDHQA
jgi:uncharacterized protein